MREKTMASTRTNPRARLGRDRRANALCLGIWVLLTGTVSSAQVQPADRSGVGGMRFTVRIDRGRDLGQNFGSLFEVPSADGALVLGAGFQGAYNTYHRADRHALSFFIRPTDGERDVTAERLPRPSEEAGTYLFDFDGTLYSSGQKLRSWNETERRWQDVPDTGDGRMRLGDGVLSFGSNRVDYNDQQILTPPAEGSYSHFYYAQGRLFFYHTFFADNKDYRVHEAGDRGFSKLYACPWPPGSDCAVELTNAAVLTLPVVGEIPFAYGQLGQDVVTCSNIGGFYAFDGRAWKTLVEPDIKTSYQIYSMVNFYERLLMGQYPTGWLFEYDGERVTQLEDWPPRIEGVSASAREAQTAAIYGGDLFIGVWPWGELWRYSHDTDRWTFVDRMFSHPAVSDETTHPYERECVAHGLVLNQWGQRVTGLVPMGDSLMVSTSAKWPCEWKPEFEFLGDDKWKEYGAVVRLKMPGNLCAPIGWTDGPTEIVCTVGGGEMSVTQDGKLLASAKLSEFLASRIAACSGLGEVGWGRGAFGLYGGVSLDGAVEVDTD